MNKWVTTAFGLLLCGCGVAIVYWLPRDMPSLGVASVLFVLGGQAVYAAQRDGEAWISKIGPLP
jgi:hypothetical protein